jgi:translocation and assembly module TamB
VTVFNGIPRFGGWARRLGLVVAVVAVLAAGLVGLCRSSVGLDIVGRIVAHLVSQPGFRVEIADLGGRFPFYIDAQRITLADAGGVWLAVEEAHLDIGFGALLRGRLHVAELRAARLEWLRLPDIPDDATPKPWSERLRMPRLPLPTAIERFTIARVAVAAPVLGERIEATAAGHATASADTTEIALNLSRTDGIAGELDFAARQSGAAPDLRLTLMLREPSGVLPARLLGRDARAPLTLALAGDGPVSDWHGRLDVAADPLARAGADIALALGPASTIALSGTATVGKLLPAELAGLTGDLTPIAARATLREDGAVALDALTIELPAGRLTADGVIGRPDRTIAATVALALSDLAPASAVVGAPLGGRATLRATVSGSEERPAIRIEAGGEGLAVGTLAAARGEAQATVTWSAATGDPSARMTIAADGELRGLVLPDSVPRALGRDLRWSLAARATPDLGLIELSEATARGAGIDIAGSGRIAGHGGVLDGRMRIGVAELTAFSGLLGQTIGGRLTLDVTAMQHGGDPARARIDGSVANLATDIPGLAALAGRSVTIAGAIKRDSDGVISLDRLALTGEAVSIGASGRFDPRSAMLAGKLDADFRDLRRAAAALDMPLAGQVTASVTIDGPAAGPRLRARLDGRGVQAGPAAFERVRLDAMMPDAMRPHAAIEGSFRAAGTDGTLSLTADAGEAREVAIRDLLVKAAGGSIGGELRIDRRTLLARGRVVAKLPELTPWSRIAGVPLSGRLDATAALDAGAGQGVELKATAERLAHGAGESRIAIGRLELTARLDDVFGTPFGRVRAGLGEIAFAAGGLSRATVTLDGPRPGRFALRAEATGRIVEPLRLTAEGAADVTPRAGAFALRLTRLDGALGPDRFALSQPLTIARRGDELTLSGLAASFGQGRLTGDMARRGAAVSLRLAARDLPVAALGRLAGYPQAGGAIAFEAAIEGPPAAPRGRFSLSGRALSLAAARQARSLALDLTGSWNGGEIDLNGRVVGGKGDALSLSGAVPLMLDARTLAVSIPPRGRLALRLTGGGDIANLADLLPLGEDRVAGRFALDAAVDGTVAAPAASGRLTVTEGQYENFATGAVLRGVRLDIVGDRDRLTIREFSARDGSGGSLAAQGGVALGGAADNVGGAVANISVTLNEFRILGRDLATASASGTVAVTGPIEAPRVAARLATDRGEINLPASLPPEVVRLDVIEINGRAGAKAGGTGTAKTRPALPATLDIEVAVPGRIFVRGRGLDSEWRGRIKVAGTSEAPQITGSLQALRGTFDVLGKTFRVTRGEIRFDGAATLDPVLDLAAEVAAADITAQVLLQGPVSAPKLTMTSSPIVPQDEILARVLFDRGLGQITAAQGLQVAAAAGNLLGGRFDLLDRVRGRLGLDRLGFGSVANTLTGANNPARSSAGTGNAASGAALTAGKYIAEGVYVGAAQGLTPGSSKAVVEIEVLPRVTVQGDVSQSGGTGIGLNYKYDY